MRKSGGRERDRERQRERERERERDGEGGREGERDRETESQKLREDLVRRARGTGARGVRASNYGSESFSGEHLAKV